jgi:hypothetical protein
MQFTGDLQGLVCAPAIHKNNLVDGMMRDIFVGDFERFRGIIHRHHNDYLGPARFFSVKCHLYLYLLAGIPIGLDAVPVCPYAANFRRPNS